MGLAEVYLNRIKEHEFNILGFVVSPNDHFALSALGQPLHVGDKVICVSPDTCGEHLNYQTKIYDVLQVDKEYNRITILDETGKNTVWGSSRFVKVVSSHAKG